MRNQSDIEDYSSSSRITIPPERKVVSKFSQHGFVRSGIVNDDSKLYNPGNDANYWSRSSYSNSDRARNLNFNDTNVNPSDWNNRYNGLSLRCL